jgi:hypothetical protein
MKTYLKLTADAIGMFASYELHNVSLLGWTDNQYINPLTPTASPNEYEVFRNSTFPPGTNVIYDICKHISNLRLIR